MGIDNRRMDLYYIQIMRPFRARYDQEPTPAARKLAVEVIGFHCASRGVYAAPRGLPSWRLMMFHEPQVVMLASGALKTEAHTLFAFPPYAPTTYGREKGRWTHSWRPFTRV